MEIQAVRYVSSLSTISKPSDLVSKFFAPYISKHSTEFILGESSAAQYAERELNEFLDKNKAAETFNQRQRIFLIASSFDEQTLSAAAWLSMNGVDINCIALNPVMIGGSHEQLALNIERLIPPSRIQDYCVSFPDAKSDRRSLTGARRRLPRMKELIEWGIVKPKDRLRLNGYDGSEAIIKDANTVLFKDKSMSFNQWGCSVTGWSAINIYDWALTSNGQTLASQRAEKMRFLLVEERADSE